MGITMLRAFPVNGIGFMTFEMVRDKFSQVEWAIKLIYIFPYYNIYLKLFINVLNNIK
jgi:hypothetical protein